MNSATWRGTTPTRRSVLKGLSLGAAAMALPPALSACSSGGMAAAASGTPTQDLSDTDHRLVVSNWALYVDSAAGDANRHPTIEQFEKKTGVAVSYSEDINDNEQFFATLRPLLAAGEPTGRDLIVMTDWMAARLIQLGYVEKLDKSAIPNAANLLPSLQHPPFDPDRDYSIPWQSGFTAIAYNKRVVDTPITSVSDMLTRKDLKGRMALFTEMRDTTGLVMLDQGADPSSFTDDDFSRAVSAIQKAVDTGQLRQFADANYGQALTRGDLAACMTYSGDVNQLRTDNPDVELVVPEAGVVGWSDNMLVPKGASHRLNAERWMNWYYTPRVAAELAAWVNYMSPVRGAQQAMRAIDPGLAKNPLIFPDASLLAKMHIYRGLTPEEEKRYGDTWNALVGA